MKIDRKNGMNRKHENCDQNSNIVIELSEVHAYERKMQIRTIRERKGKIQMDRTNCSIFFGIISMLCID
jgi:hypothetical protein